MTMTCECTEREILASTYSDVHKEAFGCRPRHDTSKWSEEAFNEAIRVCTIIAGIRAVEEAAAEAENVEELEKTITRLIAIGAADRKTAITWLAEAENVDGDMEYLCYKLGIPYGYFKSEV